MYVAWPYTTTRAAALLAPSQFGVNASLNCLLDLVVTDSLGRRNTSGSIITVSVWEVGLGRRDWRG